jgi:hypothetical protein
MPDGRCITAVTKSCFATLEDCISHGKDGSSMQVWTATFSEAANGHIIESPVKRAERLCYDDRPTRCRKWGASGECQNNPDFMRVTCRKTCGACVESPGCSVWSSSALESVLMRASAVELRAPVLRMVPPPDSRGRGGGLAINMTAWASSRLFPGHYHLSHQRGPTHVHGAKATVTVGAATSGRSVQKAAGEEGALCLAGGVSSMGVRAAELNYAVWEGCESTELRGLPFQVWRAECIAPPPQPKPKPPPATGGTQRIVAASGGRTTVTSRTTISGGTSATASVTVNVNAQSEEVADEDEEAEAAAEEDGAAGVGGGGSAAAFPQQQRQRRAAPVASAVSKRAAKLDALVAREGLTAGAEALRAMPPWQLLGVERDAAPDEVRAAFRALSRHFHPDKTTASDATLVVFRTLQRAAHEMRDPSVAAESAARFEAGRAPAAFAPPHLRYQPSVAAPPAATTPSATTPQPPPRSHHPSATTPQPPPLQAGRAFFTSPYVTELDPVGVASALSGRHAALLVYFDPLDPRCLALRPLVALAAQRLADTDAALRVGAVRCSSTADTGALCREHGAARLPAFHAVGEAGFRRELGVTASGETDFRLPELLLNGTLAAESDLQKRRAHEHDEPRPSPNEHDEL